MAIYEYGNMWNVLPDVTDVFVITTNSYIKNDGSVVMGRGIARQVRDRFDGIDKEAGQKIQHNSFYGFKPVSKKKGTFISFFQVKRHFKNKADLKLIQKSADSLAEQARKDLDVRFDLNFPGIGNGKRDVAEVKPILDGIPDNVHIWAFKEQKSKIEKI